MNYGRIILKLAKDKEKAYSCDLSFRNLNDSGHYILHWLITVLILLTKNNFSPSGNWKSNMMFFVARKLEIHGKHGRNNNQTYFPSCPMFCTTEESFQPNQAESNFETSENLKFCKVLKSFLKTSKKYALNILNLWHPDMWQEFIKSIKFYPRGDCDRQLAEHILYRLFYKLLPTT